MEKPRPKSRRCRTGYCVAQKTVPVIWGNVGTNAQHAFFQALHQGSDVVPIEFVGVARAAHALKANHNALLANMLAQGAAFALGKTFDESAWPKPSPAPTPSGARHRRAAHVPGRSPQHDDPARRADARESRRAARAARAQGVRAVGALGHQRVRSVGRRARQDACEGDRAGAGGRDRGRASRCVDAGVDRSDPIAAIARWCGPESCRRTPVADRAPIFRNTI